MNCKQAARIQKRRAARPSSLRLALLSSGVDRKPATFMHHSRHKHAMRRPRHPSGRFYTAPEIAELKRNNDWPPAHFKLAMAAAAAEAAAAAAAEAVGGSVGGSVMHSSSSSSAATGAGAGASRASLSQSRPRVAAAAAAPTAARCAPAWAIAEEGEDEGDAGEDFEGYHDDEEDEQ